MHKYVFVFLAMIVFEKTLFAQDTLPKITVQNVSNNILVSWTNPFESLTTINIQRSTDSLKNFTTIGSVLDVKNKRNGFVDSKPKITTMFYRVFLSFEGGTYIFSQSYRPVIDTTKAVIDLKDFKQAVVNTWFVPSKMVYTGRENNVIISLPEAGKKKYIIKFFEENGTQAFELKKITEPYLTLEKVNFVHAGIFNFEIYEDGHLIEKHKVYIAKDGKPMPNPIEQGKTPLK